MTIDTAAILAARYQKDPSPLKAAVLGQGNLDINPYAALRALQLQKEAQRYEMAQAAMNGQQYQNQPSMVEQALSPTAPQMPQQMPQQMQQPQGLPGMQQAQPQMQSPGLEGMPVPEASDEEYAGGGIVAFADEGLVQDEQLTSDMLADLQDKGEESPGDPNSYQSIAARLPGLLQNIERSEYKAMTPAEYKTAFTTRRALLEEGTEPSPYGALKDQIAGLESERAQNLKQASGLAMLAAASDVMQPGGLMRGLGAAGKTFAGIYGQAMQADKAEKRALMSMQFNLADAQRKEKMGLNREAIAAADQARQDHTAAQRFGLEKNKAMATVASNMARATRPTTTGGDKTPKGYDNLVAGLYGELKYKNDQLKKQNPNDPNIKADEVLLAEAHRAAAPMWAKLPAGEVMDVKRRDVAAEEKSQADTEADRKERRRQEDEKIRIEKEKLEEDRRQKKINHDKAVTEWGQAETARKKAIAEERKSLKFNRDYIKGDAATKKAMEKEIDDRYPAIPKPVWNEPAAPAPDKTSDASGNKNSTVTTTSGKVITRADIKATAKATGRSEADVEAAAKAKGYTIK